MTEAKENPGIPFEKDLLGRKAAAEFLTRYLVGRHRVAGSVPGNESFVLNVNAEWGLGKTYFLTEWAKMLRNDGHPVVYFDAWSNDFSSNPFVSFLGKVESQLTLGLPPKLNLAKTAKSVVSAGGRIIRAVAPSIAIAVVKNFTGLDGQKIAEIATDAGLDALKDIRRDLEEEHKDIRAAITAFKSVFADFASAVDTDGDANLPIFLFVDELDRCRPTYAIELLENIKHVFRIPNVYTVVATDSEQLANSIKAIYGSEFDARKYLRRFFDHESRLDEPEFKRLVAALLEVRRMNEDPRFINPLKDLYGPDGTGEVIALMARALKVTTRDLERCIDIIDSIRITSTRGQIEIIFLTFITMLYVSHPRAFELYVGNRTRNVLMKALEGKVDVGISFNEREETDPHYRGSRPIQAGVIEWLCRYVDGIWSSKPHDNRENWIGLRLAIIDSMRTESRFAPLREYHKAVALAGHYSA